MSSRLLLLIVTASSAALPSPQASSNEIKKMCAESYSLSCFKLDLLRTAQGLWGKKRRLRILPGVSLIREERTEDPEEKVTSKEELDTAVASKAENFLASLVLSVTLVEPSTLHTATNLSQILLDQVVPSQTGRRKGHGGAILWAAGTIVAIGVSVLAALSGKALVTSLLALMLAGASALRAGGGQGFGFASPSCAKGYAYIDANARNIEFFDPAKNYREPPRTVYIPNHYEVPPEQ